MLVDADLMEDEVEFEPAPSPSLGMILVIEDDPRMQKVLCRSFASEHYTVVVAGDGQKGLELFQIGRAHV